MSDDKNQMPVEVARELVRAGETRLDSLVNVAIAADMRATTLCGIFGAASVGTGAAVLVDLVSERPSTALIVAGAITAFGLFIAALLAAISGAPRDFYIGGGDPEKLRSWLWTETGWRSEASMLEATAMRYAETIEKNKKILSDGTGRIKAAFWTAFISPFIGVVAFFLLSTCPS